MKVLIFGGTGTISYDVSRLLLKKEHDISLFNRGGRNDLGFGHVKYIIGDVLDNDCINRLLKDEYYDVIIDFLTFDQEQMSCRLPILSDKCKQYIFISSATVYQNTNDIITEETPRSNFGWAYARGKLECERFLSENIDNLGFSYTIVRPYYTYDKRRLFFPLINDRTSRGYCTLIKRLQKGKPVIICGEKNAPFRFNLTNSRDLAVALEGLLLNPFAVNEDFHITSDFITSWDEIFEIIEDKIQIKCEAVHIPTEFLAKNYPVGQEEITNGLGYDHIFDNSKIHKAVPYYKSSVSVEEGLSESIDYLLEIMDYHQADEEWNAMEDEVVHKWNASGK